MLGWAGRKWGCQNFIVVWDNNSGGDCCFTCSPDSPATKIFKEKYYEKGNFLESSMGHNPSYASIWNTNSFLKTRLTRRVGNENSIKIGRDKWLWSPISYAVQSLKRILDRDDEVKELIDEDSNWWKVSLIEEIFNDEEATSICGMTIVYRPSQQATRSNDVDWYKEWRFFS